MTGMNPAYQVFVLGAHIHMNSQTREVLCVHKSQVIQRDSMHEENQRSTLIAMAGVKI